MITFWKISRAIAFCRSDGGVIWGIFGVTICLIVGRKIKIEFIEKISAHRKTDGR